MADWLILTAAHVLKTAILAGLALISWTVDAIRTDPMVLARPADGTVVVCCHSDDPAARALALRIGAGASGAWLRLGVQVPPIRVETLYTPDVLHPVVVALPPLPPAPPTT